MPSSIAEPLFDRLLRAFPADRAYTRDDWSDDPMPESIRYFLAQLLRHQGRFEAERLRRARSEWVDYDHPDMERALRTFFAAVEDHVRIPRSEWSDTLHQATHHVTSYLIQPTHVLGEFVFDDRTDPLPLDQVMWRMKFFGPYAYLRDAVRAYIKQRDDDRLTRSVFETFLRRIDHRVTAEYDADRWIRLLGPLFRLVRTATGQMAAPVEPLAIFFEEKGAGDIAERLRNRTSSSARLDPDELRGHLQQALPEDPTGAPGDGSSPLPDSVSSPLKSSSSPASSSGASPPDSAPAPSAPSSNASEPTRTPEAPSEDDSAAKPAAEESEKSSDVKSYSMEDISRGSRREDRSSDASASSPASPASDSDANASPSSDASPDPDDEIWGVEGSARAMQSADDGDAPSSSDARGGAADSSVPLWKQFQSGRSRSSRAAREEKENGSETPLWARFRSEGDAPSGGRGRPDNAASESRDAASDAETSDSSPSSTPASSASAADAAPGGSASSRSSGELAALEQSVLGERNPPQRDMYVRQLFAGSEAAYERVLRRLDKVDTWSRASQLIAQDVFRKHKVNIYSDAAVRFTNAVESRFRA